MVKPSQPYPRGRWSPTHGGSRPLKRPNSTRPSSSAPVPTAVWGETEPWPQEHCASEPAPFLEGKGSPIGGTGAALRRVVTLLLWLLVSGWADASVREVGSIGMTVANLTNEISFYTQVLPFALEGVREEEGPAVSRRFGVPNARIRTASLRLGGETLTLTEFIEPKGRVIPADSRSFDHWFQHIAIVVRDMDAAYAQLQRHKVKHVSTGPQTLPNWNPNAGGIRAFYFRDPEDHVLEIIWFPPGKGDPRWQKGAQALFLGIDHTAIVVSDTDRSLAFYRDVLGLRVAGESENYGSEQEHLNQVFGARLRITALRAEHGPGIEFLEYIAPPGGRPLPPGSRANDLIFWQTELRAPDTADLLIPLREGGAHWVSADGIASADPMVIRDPDGHGLRLEPTAVADPASGGR